ncbi:hypothetical protein GCM10011380_25160 [Sphingomonas metalli]|uniref:Uncharacterized protein n=1 Tax=Sphingomonas metalli TaxID=1779358 RepID=A0A916T7J0_9SPHN|nr:hypothetical protein [Sphingomonas metalli]GGB34693.1 hypothetical protein GCM10011380_25160 [Sphingomonas metalli]
MFKDLATKFAALALTVVTSATLVIGAVGPAQAGAGKTAVAMATRIVA